MRPAEPRRWVLLHGFTGSPGAWDEVRAALEPHGAVLCPAIMGHGGLRADEAREAWAPPPGAGGQASRPAAAQAEGRFVSEVDRLAHLIVAAGFDRSHLCGYSLGGRLALGLLVRHPQLFTRATLIGAHPGLPEGALERTQRAADDERWAQLAERDAAAFLERWAAQPLFDTQRAAPAGVRAAQAAVRAAHDGGALAAALRALSLARMPDWHPFLSRIAVPVHVMAGALDAKFAALGQQLAARIPGARLTLVPGTGHNVVLEQPAAVVAALLD